MTEQIQKEFSKKLWQSAFLYALFLLPTFLLFNHAHYQDAALAQNISGVWQARFWQLPGWSSTASRIVLDSLEAIAIGGLAWLYYQGFQLLNHLSGFASQSVRRTLWLWPVVCGILLWAVVPFHSSDLYGYLNRGFQQSVYQVNPYLVTVSEIPNWQNDFRFHAHWIYNPCPYGFFFAKLVAWITELAGLRFFPAFLLMKGFSLLMVWGTTGLIGAISRQLNLKRPWLNVYLFGANPLILLHAVGNGHNDVLLAFLLMAALWAMLSVRWQWACLPLLTLSILTKYASLLALPFLALYCIQKKNYQALVMGVIISALMTLLLASPYIDPHHAWPLNAMLDNAGKPQHSIVALLSESMYYLLKGFHGPASVWRDSVLSIAKPLFWLIFMGFYGWQGLQAFKSALSPSRLIYGIGLTMTVMIIGISAKFHPWYLIMCLPILLLLPENTRLRQFGLTISLFQLTAFTVFQNLPVFNELALTVLPLWLTLSGHSPFKPASLQ